MPNSLTASGLMTMTRQELIDYFTLQYQSIYGTDINLASDTPDGQMMNIFVQSILDLLDLVTQVYNQFDPDNAVGVVLDQRVAINGIQRRGGTYTVTNITLVNTTSVTMYGLDQVDEDSDQLYTISDNAGNRWFLEETQLGLSAGVHVLSFRAAVPGAQLTTPNTINVQVTIVLGVASVNNPTTYTTLGVNTETDAELKIRRQRSVSISSQGYLAGLLAALLNIEGVTAAFVYENDTGTTDSDGIPGHSIWVIVGGTAEPADIAQAIYAKRNAGCGMKGDVTYAVTQVDGTTFTVRWDDVVEEPVFVFMTLTSVDPDVPPDIEAIRAGLPGAYIPEVNQAVNISALAAAVQTLDSNAVITAAGFSLARLQSLGLSGVAASGTFKFKYNGNESAAVNWNDNIGVIQTKLQGIAGLEDATISGSIAGQSLAIDLDALSTVLGLVTITSNSLATSGPVAITFAYDYDEQAVLDPSTKKDQLILSAPFIVITPMQLQPEDSALNATETETFEGLGGYGTLVYSLQSNVSGATIDASTGEYTAGSTPGTDVVKVTDALGNTATAEVIVT